MKKDSATSNIKKVKRAGVFLKHLFLFLLIAFLSFGLGWLSKIESQKTPVTVEYSFEALPESMRGSSVNFTEEISKEIGVVLGSINGSVYHLPWCPGAKQINEENKVWFETREEAEQLGYSPAKNCKGL